MKNFIPFLSPNPGRVCPPKTHGLKLDESDVKSEEIEAKHEHEDENLGCDNAYSCIHSKDTSYQCTIPPPHPFKKIIDHRHHIISWVHSFAMGDYCQ